MPIEQIGALGAQASDNTAGNGATGNKRLADLGSIGQDSTHFGAARVQADDEDSNMGKLAALGAALGGVILAIKTGRADRLVSMLGSGARRFAHSGLAKSLKGIIDKIPTFGPKITESITGQLKNLQRVGNHANGRIRARAAEAVKAAAEGAPAVAEKVVKGATEAGEAAVKVVT